MEKPSYYAILPANVRYAETLTPNAKLLYAEITALAQKDGTCWASNKYFAKLYNVTPETVSRWVSVLVVNGFVLRQITYLKGTKQIDKRYLQLNQEGIDKIIKTPIDKIVKDNNTSINNTSINNISNRKNDFVFEVLTFDYEESILNGFIDYWTEPNKSNTKMKFELNKTWKTELRLKTWATNQKKWDKPKSNSNGMSKLDAQINEWQKAKDLL
jgi:hypothetical protein